MLKNTQKDGNEVAPLLPRRPPHFHLC